MYAADPLTMAQNKAAMAARYRERYLDFKNTEMTGRSKVYFTKKIDPEDLASIYEALGKPIPTDAKVSVKINMAEAGNVNRLDPNLIMDLVKGHSSAGYGGTFKNLAIGIASYNGKKAIHQDKPTDVFFATIAELFQEKVVEYNQALMENSKFKP